MGGKGTSERRSAFDLATPYGGGDRFREEKFKREGRAVRISGKGEAPGRLFSSPTLKP